MNENPAWSDDTVAIVVDPACGERLEALVRRMPVWVADTPGNRAAIDRLTGELRAMGTGSLTRFVANPRGTPESWLASIIDDVELHHGEYSQDEPCRRLEVHGATLTPELRVLLRAFGFGGFEAQPFGFSVSREA